MKKLLIAAAAFAALVGGANAQQVRIATEGAYAPWNFIDDAGNLAGFEIDLGNELCKRAALDCVWIQNAWDTMIPNLIAGNYDAIMAGMSITDERKEIDRLHPELLPADPLDLHRPRRLDDDLRSALGRAHRRPGRHDPGRLCRSRTSPPATHSSASRRRTRAWPISTPATSTPSSSSVTSSPRLPPVRAAR